MTDDVKFSKHQTRPINAPEWWDARHPLSITQDNFEGHPVDEATVIIENLFYARPAHKQIVKTAQIAGVTVISHGLHKRGRAVRLADRKQAALFRLFCEHSTSTHE